MAYFPSTTGQGQGFAQMVNPRESKVGDIVSTYVDDYLEQERQSQIAQQKKNAFEARADVLQNNLDKVFKSEFNRYFSEVEEKQRKGEISAKDATDIIINYGKELKSLQDQSFKFNGEGMYSFDENGAVSDPKLKLIELGFEQDDYDDPQATIQQMKNVMMRSKKKPTQLSEQFNSKIIPLLKQVENVFTTEELGASGDEFIEIIKTNSKSIPPRTLEKIKEQFVNDEDVQEAIVLNNGMYKVTPQGVDLEGDIETVETMASDFFDQMTQPKVEVIEDLQKKGGGSGTGETNQVLVDDKLSKEVAEETEGYEDILMTEQGVTVLKPNSRTSEQMITVPVGNSQKTGIVKAVRKRPDGTIEVRVDYKQEGRTKSEYSDIDNIREQLTETQYNSLIESVKEPTTRFNLDKFIEDVKSAPVLGMNNRTDIAQNILKYTEGVTNVIDPKGEIDLQLTYNGEVYRYNFDNTDDVNKFKEDFDLFSSKNQNTSSTTQQNKEPQIGTTNDLPD